VPEGIPEDPLTNESIEMRACTVVAPSRREIRERSTSASTKDRMMKMAIGSIYGLRSNPRSRFSPDGWRWALPLASLACLACLAACGSPSDASETDATAATAQALLDEPAEPTDEPGEDEDLAFLRQDGFQTFHFALDCVSVGEDGSTIGGEPLPVGGGRSLECVTESLGSLSTVDALSSTGERFCALGQVDSFHGDGDPSLAVSVASTPEGSPWTLVGTHDGDEIQIGKVTGFGGGTAWPLWVDAHYAVIDITPNPSGQLCDQAFGL
jgi:hypothetical protein